MGCNCGNSAQASAVDPFGSNIGIIGYSPVAELPSNSITIAALLAGIAGIGYLVITKDTKRRRKHSRY